MNPLAAGISASFMEGAKDLVALVKYLGDKELEEKKLGLEKQRVEQTGQYQQGLLGVQEKMANLREQELKFKQEQWQENQLDREIMRKAQINLNKLREENLRLEKQIRKLQLQNQSKLIQTDYEKAKINLEIARLKRDIYINKLAQVKQTKNIKDLMGMKDSALKDWQAYYKALVNYLKPMGGQTILSDNFNIQDTPKLFDLYNQAMKSPNLTPEQKNMLKSTFNGLMTSYSIYQWIQKEYNKQILGTTGNIFEKRSQQVSQPQTIIQQSTMQTPISSAYANMP